MLHRLHRIPDGISALGVVAATQADGASIPWSHGLPDGVDLRAVITGLHGPEAARAKASASAPTTLGTVVIPMAYTA